MQEAVATGKHGDQVATRSSKHASRLVIKEKKDLLDRLETQA